MENFASLYMYDAARRATLCACVCIWLLLMVSIVVFHMWDHWSFPIWHLEIIRSDFALFAADLAAEGGGRGEDMWKRHIFIFILDGEAEWDYYCLCLSRSSSCMYANEHSISTCITQKLYKLHTYVVMRACFSFCDCLHSMVGYVIAAVVLALSYFHHVVRVCVCERACECSHTFVTCSSNVFQYSSSNNPDA